MCVVKITEVIGASPKSFEGALREILEKMKKEDVTGMDIISQNVVVKKNKIMEYRIVAKVASVEK